jgi:predicted AlkP superfamily pyrophosphatase or phosphodiesterase
MTLIDLGVFSFNVESVYPSVTYPSHVSMITGVSPSRHGILSNNRYDPKQEGRGLNLFASEVRALTIFDAAHQLGLTTSAVFWPVTAFSESLDHAVPDIPIRTPVEADFAFYGCLKGSVAHRLVPNVTVMTSLTDDHRLQIALNIM